MKGTEGNICIFSLSWTEENSEKCAVLTIMYYVTLSILSFSCSKHFFLHLFVLSMDHV